MSLTDVLYQIGKQAKEFIFFTQERVGLEDKLFTLYKFRTMENGRENEEGKWSEINGRDNFGYIIDDPRVTYLGKYLRTFWIDELPQIWNIWNGDMKLVGYRPLSPKRHAKLPHDLKRVREKNLPGLMPVTYSDYFGIRSDEDRWQSEREYFNQLERGSWTDVKYFFRILKTMGKLTKNSLTMEMYKWTNAMPYV